MTKTIFLALIFLSLSCQAQAASFCEGDQYLVEFSTLPYFMHSEGKNFVWVTLHETMIFNMSPGFQYVDPFDTGDIIQLDFFQNRDDSNPFQPQGPLMQISRREFCLWNDIFMSSIGNPSESSFIPLWDDLEGKLVISFLSGSVDLREVSVSVKKNGITYSQIFPISEVPIPSAILLLGSGLIGLVGFRRKFRKP